MSLSELNRMRILAGIPLNESKEVKWEFQLRDIGGPVFYKRKKGGDWQFISAQEFAENCQSGKLIKWNEES